MIRVARQEPRCDSYRKLLNTLLQMQNARQKRGDPQDHRHRLRTIRAYEYQDAATLLGDFWETVDALLRERGVIP